jgi:hypothetical protein
MLMSLMLMSFRKAVITLSAADSSLKGIERPDDDSPVLSRLPGGLLSSGTPKRRVLDDAKSE